MTITLAWLRKKPGSTELLIASDSRLRSCGAMDQSQKLFLLGRGDCCLAFCGDAQVAYPLFVQIGTALNNYIKTRSRAEDFSQVRRFVGQILNNLIDSWDLSLDEKVSQLGGTRILFAGWSWIETRFDVGFFQHNGTEFIFVRDHLRLPHPWREKERGSLTFIGDYREEYTRSLTKVLEDKYPRNGQRSAIYNDWDFEPLEALYDLLEESRIKPELYLIGGAPQIIKVYSFGNSLPFVIRRTQNEHYLLGRRLFDWEKTERPIIDLSKRPTKTIYPLSAIPVPALLHEELLINEPENVALSVLLPTEPSGPGV